MKIGIVGGGQLGRMLGLAAIPLGLQCRFLDASITAPAAAVGSIQVGELHDPDAIIKLAREVDVLTTEFENVSADALRQASAVCKVAPSPDAIATAQDRLLEKTLFRDLEIGTADFLAVNNSEDCHLIGETVAWPAVMKTRRMGYDGRGQSVVNDATEAIAAFKTLGSVPCIAEGLVRFERELSLIAARSMHGETVFYSLCENTHTDGILATTIAPYDDADLQIEAQKYMTALLEHFAYVGVLTIEFFHANGHLLANEMAPRVHNSGHWSIEGATTSQFENHIRAVAGLPLGDTTVLGHSAMINLLGTMPDRDAVLAVAGAHLHDYGKTPRPGRKLGHCTMVDSDPERLLNRLKLLQIAKNKVIS